MAKWTEYFIAQRTAQAQADGGEREGEAAAEGGISSSIATLAISLSLCVMILTIAVIIGFKSEVHNRLTALSGDIIVTTHRGPNPSIIEPITRGERIEQVIKDAVERHGSLVRHISPYVARSVVVRSPSSIEGVILKGVDSASLPSGKRRDAIVSQELAAEAELEVGSRLELLAIEEGREKIDGSEGDGQTIRRDLYRVGAIRSNGGGDAEKLFITTDIRNLQRLNGWSAEEISGYEIGVTERERAALIAREINREILYCDTEQMDGVAAFSIEQLYPNIFDWLNALDINAVVVISIMMIVALFNIITAILILVLERMQMVGILKTLGMNNHSIRNIFLHRALSITLRGMAWGNGIGVGLALLQHHFKIIKLNEAGYMLSSVPIDMSIGWLLLLNIGVLFAILLSVMLPTRIVSSIEPHKAVKFQ